jgi:hypothetical protein
MAIFSKYDAVLEPDDEPMTVHDEWFTPLYSHFLSLIAFLRTGKEALSAKLAEAERK